MKFFLSCPMKGKSKKEIFEIRARLVQKLQKYIDDYGTIEVQPLLNEVDLDNNLKIKYKQIYLIGKSLEQLAESDNIVMAKEWDQYPGCIIENRAAIYYNVPIIHEENL